MILTSAFTNCILIASTASVWNPGWTAPFMLKTEQVRYDVDQTCVLTNPPPGEESWWKQAAVTCLPDDGSSPKTRILDTEPWVDVEMECAWQVSPAGVPPAVIEAMETIRDWRKP